MVVGNVVAPVKITPSGRNSQKDNMLKRLKELYQQYKPYVRVDLIMYGVLILMIILYFIITVIWG